MIKHWRIGNKLAIVIIAFTLTVVGIVSFLFYSQFKSALNERVLLQLNSIMKLKKGQIENQFDEYIKSAKVISKNYKSGTISPENFDHDRFLEMIVRKSDSTIVGQEKIFSKSIAKQIPEATFKDSILLYDLTSNNPEGTILIAFQESIDDETELILLSEMSGIQEILYERTGMGQTGESYIVGSDLLMRSRSRFFPEKPPASITVNTPGVSKGLNANAGRSVFPDYRGVEVFSAFDKLDIPQIDWVLLSEIDREEAEEPLNKVRSNLSIILVVVAIIVLILTYYLSQFIVKPILNMAGMLNQMAKGDIRPGTNQYNSDDEIGKMFAALDSLINTLQQAILFADRIGSGDFNAQYSLANDNDMLGLAMIQMREKLKEFKQKEEELIKENQKSLINGEEGERARIAKELHDGLGPLLTSLRMYVQSLKATTTEKEQLKSMLDETIKEVRRISNNLMPSVLLDFGVGEALRNLVAQMQGYSEIKIRYVNSVKPNSKIPPDINIALYRIAQESLNNAIKHAGATEIKMSITSFDEFINFFISDNGQGFDYPRKFKGSGLRNMRERVHLLNGEFNLETSPAGTKIEVEIPLT